MPLAALAGTTRVIVVINDQSPESKAVGQYYATKRGVPARNICHINVEPNERITLLSYHEKIRKPILAHINKYALGSADFIVTTKGVPLVDNRGFSVDSMLTMLHTGLEKQASNPYYGRGERFKSGDFRMFLVTRLDGCTTADAKALVDRALKAPGKRGKFLIDLDPMEDTRPGYSNVNADMRSAALGLLENRIPYIFDDSSTFVGGQTGLMGYYSWGSNDIHFDRNKYKSNKFVPGAIAETVVSTSARTFKPTTGGQSLITDLISSGITGVKGYVSEPYSTSMARASILFDRYTHGYTLAESFYMASPFICWKDVVIGDPLCAPYAHK